MAFRPSPNAAAPAAQNARHQQRFKSIVGSFLFLPTLLGAGLAVAPAATAATGASLSVVATTDTPSTTYAGERVTYSFLVTNTGTVDLTNVGVQETSTPKLFLLGTGCPKTTLPVGGWMTCSVTHTFQAGETTTTTTVGATGTPAAGSSVTSAPSSTTVTVPGTTGALTVKASSTPAWSTGTPPLTLTPGQPVTFTAMVTNNGAEAVSNIEVHEGTPFHPTSANGEFYSCPSTNLAAGASMTCSYTFAPTQSDLNYWPGLFSTEPMLDGTLPTGQAVFAPFATAEIRYATAAATPTPNPTAASPAPTATAQPATPNNSPATPESSASGSAAGITSASNAASSTTNAALVGARVETGGELVSRAAPSWPWLLLAGIGAIGGLSLAAVWRRSRRN